MSLRQSLLLIVLVDLICIFKYGEPASIISPAIPGFLGACVFVYFGELV